MNQPPDEQPLFFFDQDRLRQIAEERVAEYAAAEPFPHVVIDDFVPEWVIDRVLQEFPGPDDIEWERFVNQREKKLAAADDAVLGPFTRHLLSQFNSATFVRFLERLSGIDGLVPDPWFVGGGLHQIQRGGFLKVHADFNKHRKLRLDRRLNALLYLNKDWSEEFGGALELWDREMTRPVRKALPLAGRLLVFSTTSDSFHGHPDPLTCPPDRMRRSMALYYYSNGRPEEGIEGPVPEHSTLFQPRPGERDAGTDTRERLKQFVPPIALDALKKVRSARTTQDDRTPQP
jgi:hypothetical protein